MLTVIVTLQVRPDRVEEFLRGIRANATASLGHEPGCLRFDVHRSTERPLEFILHEIYADRDAFYTGHRNAAHYAAWRTIAARCVEEGGQVVTLATPAFPEDLPESQKTS